VDVSIHPVTRLYILILDMRLLIKSLLIQIFMDNVPLQISVYLRP